MKLFYKHLEGPGEPLIVLHGLLGMSDNWLSPAKELSKRYNVYLLDARNHGRSPHSSDFSYEMMTQDLKHFMDQQEIIQAHILGHSMGGKTAMKFAQNFPEYVIKLVVADISPKKYPLHHQAIFSALHRANIQNAKERKEVYQSLLNDLKDENTVQFLLKNVTWGKDKNLKFRFNLESIETHIEEIGEEIMDLPFNGPTLFLRGEKSNYITAEDFNLIPIVFPNAAIKTIKNAGHWLHAEQPTLFVGEVMGFLG